MNWGEFLAELAADPRARVVDTRGVFVAAAGPYLSPSLAGVPGESLDALIASGAVEPCDGPLGLAAWQLRRKGGPEAAE